MDIATQQKWLRWAAGLTMATGLLMAMAAHPATNQFIVWLTDVILWPIDGAQTGSATDTRLLYAISGGVLAGLGYAVWLVAGEVMDRDPDLARRIILRSLTLWFVIDSAGSFAAGAPLNVAFNMGFFALFLTPLMRGRSLAQA